MHRGQFLRNFFKLPVVALIAPATAVRMMDDTPEELTSDGPIIMGDGATIKNCNITVISSTEQVVAIHVIPKALPEHRRARFIK